jgi:predicted ArsR family transcriptional regulator
MKGNFQPLDNKSNCFCSYLPIWPFLLSFFPANVSRWARRFLESTRGKIILLLRPEARTVAELAEALSLTDNAVRAHLATLERDGLVRQGGERPGFRKPHFSYELTAEGEELFPKAYGPLLDQILAQFKERFGSEQLETVMREVGRRMAAAQMVPDASALEERLEQAVKILASLGGQARIERDDGKVLIRGAGCPFSDATANHAEVCRLVETLLAEIIDAPVRESCQRGPSPHCCFEIGAAANRKEASR